MHCKMTFTIKGLAAFLRIQWNFYRQIFQVDLILIQNVFSLAWPDLFAQAFIN